MFTMKNLHWPHSIIGLSKHFLSPPTSSGASYLTLGKVSSGAPRFYETFQMEQCAPPLMWRRGGGAKCHCQWANSGGEVSITSSPVLTPPISSQTLPPPTMYAPPPTNKPLQKQGPKRHKPWLIQKFRRSHHKVMRNLWESPEKVIRKSRESHEKVMRKS